MSGLNRLQAHHVAAQCHNISTCRLLANHGDCRFRAIETIAQSFDLAAMLFISADHRQCAGFKRHAFQRVVLLSSEGSKDGSLRLGPGPIDLGSVDLDFGNFREA